MDDMAREFEAALARGGGAVGYVRVCGLTMDWCMIG